MNHRGTIKFNETHISFMDMEDFCPRGLYIIEDLDNLLPIAFKGLIVEVKGYVEGNLVGVRLILDHEEHEAKEVQAKLAIISVYLQAYGLEKKQNEIGFSLPASCLSELTIHNF